MLTLTFVINLNYFWGIVDTLNVKCFIICLICFVCGFFKNCFIIIMECGVIDNQLFSPQNYFFVYLFFDKKILTRHQNIPLGLYNFT